MLNIRFYSESTLTQYRKCFASFNMMSFAASGRSQQQQHQAQLTERPVEIMMHRLLLVVLAAAGVSVLGLPRLEASPPGGEPCTAPLQWEGRWVMYDHSTGRNSRAAVSYDGLNQRIRVLQQHKKHTPCQRFFEYIYLYQSMVMFQIDQKTKDCSKVALTEDWDPFDIPANSTFEEQYFIGGPGDNVEVQEWSDRKPARQHETWVGVYTLKDCYPVQETYTRNSSVTTSTRFLNLQLGISDPDVFTPPTTCQSARPQRMVEC